MIQSLMKRFGYVPEEELQPEACLLVSFCDYHNSRKRKLTILLTKISTLESVQGLSGGHGAPLFSVEGGTVTVEIVRLP
jgi:hypothetical protein